MSLHRGSYRPAGLIAIQFVAALGVILVLLTGIFFWGRLAEDDRAAMLLTAAWFTVVLVAGALVTRKRASLRRPLAIGYGIVAVGATIVLGLPMLRDDVVNERVESAAPIDRSGAGSRAAVARNTQIASGTFRSIAHPGTGTAALVELANGTRVLTLTDFETDNGPDLRVYLSTRDPARGGELGDFKDLGALKGNKGNQQYNIPANLDPGRFSTVVIWCRAFSVGFTSAALTRP